MKKRILAGLLSLTALAWNTPLLQAGWLFNRCCGCSKYSSTITVRPYNAFSPVCYGNMTMVGCPFPFFGPGFGGPGFGGPGFGPPPSCLAAGPSWGHHGDPCDNGACIGDSLPPVPHEDGAPAAPPQGAPGGGPSFTPPNPAPVNPTSQIWPGMMAAPYGTVQAAAFRPPYHPAYYGFHQPHPFLYPPMEQYNHHGYGHPGHYGQPAPYGHPGQAHPGMGGYPAAPAPQMHAPTMLPPAAAPSYWYGNQQ